MRYFVVVVILLAGCTTQPQTDYTVGERLLDETFDSASAWEQAAVDGVTIGVVNGMYQITADVNSYVRGFYRTGSFDDVVIDVLTQQISLEDNNAYGVVCRGAMSQEQATGYYFLIGGDGSYSIQKGKDGDLHPLVHWARSDVINQGRSFNQIRVICIEDYLALYVNDRFVADTRDQSYETGRIGLVATTAEDTVIEVRFDDLVVLQGMLGRESHAP